MNDRDHIDHRDDERVDVTAGHPTDRVRWGPILAGTFAALTALTVLTTLGAAIGLTAYDAGDDARRFAIGSGVWGILSMILAFAFGGWLAARSAAVHGPGNGTLNGFMVAGVAIPLMMFLLGSAATLMSHAEVANNRDTASARGPAVTDSATQAGAVLGANNNNNANQPAARQREDASRTGSRAAWSTLVGLILAIGAASVGGRMGTRDHDDHDDRDHRARHNIPVAS